MPKILIGALGMTLLASTASAAPRLTVADFSRIPDVEKMVYTAGVMDALFPTCSIDVDRVVAATLATMNRAPHDFDQLYAAMAVSYALTQLGCPLNEKRR